MKSFFFILAGLCVLYVSFGLWILYVPEALIILFKWIGISLDNYFWLVIGGTLFLWMMLFELFNNFSKLKKFKKKIRGNVKKLILDFGKGLLIGVANLILAFLIFGFWALLLVGCFYFASLFTTNESSLLPVFLWFGLTLLFFVLIPICFKEKILKESGDNESDKILE